MLYITLLDFSLDKRGGLLFKILLHIFVKCIEVIVNLKAPDCLLLYFLSWNNFVSFTAAILQLGYSVVHQLHQGMPDLIVTVIQMIVGIKLPSLVTVYTHYLYKQATFLGT